MYNNINSSCFDITIIGGGVVGCAIARRFVLEGAKVLLLEKASDILDGASKANSAILHTGFDAPVGSVEADCIKAGYQEYLDIYQRLNLPRFKTGAYVVAWNDAQLTRLDNIVKQAHTNGITDVHRVSSKQLLRAEPNLASHALGAVSVPGESLIDPWSAPYAYLKQAVVNGGKVQFNTQVIGGSFDGSTWQLHCRRTHGPSSDDAKTIATRFVINCAGLYGDQLDQTCLGEATFTIKPRKGQFVVYDKVAAKLIKHIILPVPTEWTKGVVLTPTVFGNLLVGPTAEEQPSRESATVDQASLRSLIQQAETVLPALKGIPVTATYAGLRPATEHKDYRLRSVPNKHWITVGGIRSTGLSAALGLAQQVWGLYADAVKEKISLKEKSPAAMRFQPIVDPDYPKVQNLAEGLPRDWMQPGYGEIVCHCEKVTQREIEQALNGSLPPQSIAGLKRRTRVMMGRCQGFYCSACVAELTHGRFAHNLAQDKTDSAGVANG